MSSTDDSASAPQSGAPAGPAPGSPVPASVPASGSAPASASASSPTPPSDPASRPAPVVRSFAALGDSFTEGMSDLLPDGSYRGWADLLAARLAVGAGGDFRYANLAVRGKLIGQIAADQVDAAASMNADLVTLVGGLNDTLRPRCDMARVCGLLEESVEKLAPSCGRLVLMRSPGRQGPVLDRYRGRMEELFAFIDTLASRHGALVADLYTGEPLADRRLWADDRLHLTGEGHRRVAEALCETLGLPADAQWRAPLPPSPATPWSARLRADLRFTRRHLAPWIGRRLTGRSSGDGRAPKRPELTPLACEDTP